MIGHRSSRGTARAGAGDAGFTLIEILIATVIMLIVSMGVITALSFSGWATTFTGQRTKALNLANQYIEKARNLDYDKIGTYSDGGVYGEPPGDIHTPDVVGDFTVTTRIYWQRDVSRRSQYKNIEVTVTWTRPITGSVKLTTSIFGKTHLTNVGDLELTLLDHDTNQPIVGVPVTVVPQGSAQPRTVVTDASGVAFFGMVPTGQATVTMSTTTSWVFDKTTTADFPVINVSTGDVLSSYTIKGQKPSALQIRVIGTHGDGLSGVTVSMPVMGTTQSGPTDPNGYITFTMLPQATYTVTAARWDRETNTASMLVPSPTSTTQPLTGTITLHDPAAILYKVTGANVNDLKDGATVTLYTQAGVAVSSGTTAGGGLVTLQAISVGNYYATAKLGVAQGRHPSTAGTYLTPPISASDWGTTRNNGGAGYLIQIYDPGTIRVNVLKTGGGAFPYDVPINVDGTLHNSVAGTWDFLVPDLRTYSVSASYTNRRPFSTNVTISSYGQLVIVPALLDDLSDMTVQVVQKWGNKNLNGATVAAVGPESDTLATGPTGLASFTAANSHAMYGTNQSGDTPYTITASKSGYHDGTLTGVSLVPGQTLSPNPVIYLTTTNTGTFVITTKNNSTNAIRPNAVIRITGPTSSPDGISSTTMDFTSDASGKITIDYLPLGRYTFSYKSGSYYYAVSTPTSKTLNNDGDSLTFDVKW